MSKPQFIAVARIIRPQGRRGEVAADLVTDYPDRFAKLDKIFVGNADGTGGRDHTLSEFAVERAWPHKGRIVLKLGGIDSISAAEALRGHAVFIPYAERVPLPEGAYYHFELEQCRVVAGPPGDRIDVGTVASVEPAPGVPLLHVRRIEPGRDEILIPLAREICREIDLDAKLIVIDPPEDLLELNG